MRTIVGTFVGLMAFATVSVQAAPIATKPMRAELGAPPSIELARQDCGPGWHRTHCAIATGIGTGAAAFLTGADTNGTVFGPRGSVSV